MRLDFTITDVAKARLAGLLALGVLVSDQITKAWILYGLKLPVVGKIELSNVVDLTMVWNYGVSFGMLRADSALGRWMLVLFAGVVALALAYWALKAQRTLTAIALGLVVGGAIGNLIDRVRFGAVADFIDFSGPWFGLTLPAEGGLFAWIDGFFRPDGVLGVGFPYVFNIADAGITIGVLTLFVDLFLEQPEDKPTAS